MGERVFIGSCAGRFYGVDRHSGEISWTYDTSQDGQAANFHGDPLVLEERIIVGADVARQGDGHVYCFDHRTGRVQWKYTLSGGVISKIESYGSYVYGVTENGDLLCLRLADGGLVWQTRPDVEAARASLAYDVLVYEDRVVYSSIGGMISSVNPIDGSLIWKRSLNGTVNTSLVIQDTSLWVGTLEGEFHRIDAQTGKLLRTYELQGMPYGSPVALDRSILLLLDGNTLSHMSTDDGRTLWQLKAVDEWSSFKPVRRGDLVWVGNGQGQLVGVSLESGQPEQVLSVDGTVRGFLMGEEAAYIGTLQGKMHALQLATE